jgi:hypothetical protein
VKASRRAFKRIRMQMMAAQATLLRANGAVRFPVRLADLSSSGARVLVPRRPEIGDTLYLHLPPGSEGGHTLDVAAQISWVEPLVERFYCCGLAFNSVLGEEHAAIVARVLVEEKRRAQRLESLLSDVRLPSRGGRARLPEAPRSPYERALPALPSPAIEELATAVRRLA